MAGADPGFLKGGGGGVQARIQDFSQAPPLDIVRVTSSTGSATASWVYKQKKRGGGPTLGPMLKNLHRGPKGGGGSGPPAPPPPWIRHVLHGVALRLGLQSDILGREAKKVEKHWSTLYRMIQREADLLFCKFIDLQLLGLYFTSFYLRRF